MKKTKKFLSFSRRLTRRLVLCLFVIMAIMSFWILLFMQLTTRGIYPESHHSNMIATMEYTRRIQSDVYVATVNNVYAVEENLDKPDELKHIMERIVKDNPRIRSCGLSFIDSYYPKKGRQFCPYAWRSADNDSVVLSKDMNKTESDYLTSQWFTDIIKSDSAQWSEPFVDGYSSTTPLMAYMVPIHDKARRTVAVLGADLSLEWLKDRLKETDSLLNRSIIGKGSFSFLIRRDGTYITHKDEKRIIKDNFFDHIKAYDVPFYSFVDSELDNLVNNIKNGNTSSTEGFDVFMIDGQKNYVFYTPVKYTDWMLITGVKSFYLDLLVWGSIIVILFFIGVTMGIIVAMCFITIQTLLIPLRKLTKSANEVAKGNFNTQLPLMKHNDEISQLRDSFENMLQSLNRYMDDLKETTASKAAIENELKIAHDIQMSMLPKIFPPFPERKDMDIYGQVSPAKAVGGDLFDFFIHDEHLFFCIGDVSGKGVPASLVMAVTRSLFRNISAHTSHPGHILKTLNNALSENNDANMFVTLFVGVLNLQTHQLHYCNAGHDAPLLIGQDVTVLPVESNLPVGIMPEMDFKAQQTVIEQNTTIFLFTDGLTEAEDSVHRQFGEDRVMSVARKAIGTKTFDPKPIIEQMTAAVHDFVGEAEQSDDLTMLAIKLKGTS